MSADTKREFLFNEIFRQKHPTRGILLFTFRRQLIHFSFSFSSTNSSTLVLFTQACQSKKSKVSSRCCSTQRKSNQISTLCTEPIQKTGVSGRIFLHYEYLPVGWTEIWINRKVCSKLFPHGLTHRTHNCGTRSEMCERQVWLTDVKNDWFSCHDLYRKTGCLRCGEIQEPHQNFLCGIHLTEQAESSTKSLMQLCFGGGILAKWDNFFMEDCWRMEDNRNLKVPCENGDCCGSLGNRWTDETGHEELKWVERGNTHQISEIRNSWQILTDDKFECDCCQKQNEGELQSVFWLCHVDCESGEGKAADEQLKQRFLSKVMSWTMRSWQAWRATLSCSLCTHPSWSTTVGHTCRTFATENWFDIRRDGGDHSMPRSQFVQFGIVWFSSSYITAVEKNRCSPWLGKCSRWRSPGGGRLGRTWTRRDACTWNSDRSSWWRASTSRCGCAAATPARRQTTGRWWRRSHCGPPPARAPLPTSPTWWSASGPARENDRVSHFHLQEHENGSHRTEVEVHVAPCTKPWLRLQLHDKTGHNHTELAMLFHNTGLP